MPEKLIQISYILIRLSTAVVEKHDDRHSTDDGITRKAQQVRNLSEQEKAHQRRENDLGVIEHRDFTRRGERVRRRDRKLTACRRKAGEQKKAQLFQRHGMKIEQQKREHAQAGKRRKEKDNERAPFPMQGEVTHCRISHPCAQRTYDACQCGNNV